MPDPGDSRRVLQADAEAGERLAIDVVHDSGEWPDLDAIEALVRRVASALAASPVMEGHGRALACVALSSDAAVRTLNARYRGFDKPTNVLSFPSFEASGGKTPLETGEPRFLGDVVLAAETVAREARERGIAFEDHLQHLVLHGLLHLLGYDHETDEEAEVMETLETSILARLGVADPHGSDGLGEMMARKA